ncbi:MAG: hypothetical protein IJ439_04910 [Tyzzerella sp.]|nr:hypothetical protein [Tyzzerella sp.]
MMKERQIGINTFTLKMIAIVSMLIDHIGAVLFPQYEIFRILGRLAFPIFAYTLVEGFMHTHDVKKYMLRLGALALISEIPFDLAFNGAILEFGHQNVFFTLFLGILMLYLALRAPTNWQRVITIVAMLVLADLLRTDYSSMGLLMIFWFYQFRENKLVKYIGIALVNVLCMGGIQIYAILSLIPIALHNGEQGRKCKAFFYGFYPVHLLVLYFICLLM